MDAAPESSVISSFLDSDRFSRSEQVPPSFEGLVAQIVAAKPNKAGKSQDIHRLKSKIKLKTVNYFEI